MITAIDGEKIGDFNAMYRTVTGSAGTPLTFTVAPGLTGPENAYSTWRRTPDPSTGLPTTR